MTHYHLVKSNAMTARPMNVHLVLYKTPPSQTSRLTSTGGDAFGWKVGDKAVHKVNGVQVWSLSVKGEGDGMELDIAFPEPTGIKRLLAKFAPITKA